MRIATTGMRLASLLLAFASTAAAQTPAEIAVAHAQQLIARRPDSAPAHAALGLAWARRARETADGGFYERGMSAVRCSLELAPDNFAARKVEAWILLGRHEFAAGLEAARALGRRAPDDLAVYAMLVDANVELGRYTEAEQAAQWLLDLRPGNVAGLTRAAYLRELFGDLAGAIDMMEQALDRVPLDETEERAWLLTQIAHLERHSGRPGRASRAAAAALDLFPGYHYALAELARVRTDQGRHAEAAELLRGLVAAAPHPENFFYLAEALYRADREDAARRTFLKFEVLARGEMASLDNANRELVRYYVDHADRPEEALRIARLEIGRRRDVYTRDALAWALYASGDTDAARREIEATLAVGIRDPDILRHAQIIRAAGD